MNRLWWLIDYGMIVVGVMVEMVGALYVVMHVKSHYTMKPNAIAYYCKVKDIESWQFSDVFRTANESGYEMNYLSC